MTITKGHNSKNNGIIKIIRDLIEINISDHFQINSLKFTQAEYGALCNPDLYLIGLTFCQGPF